MQTYLEFAAKHNVTLNAVERAHRSGTHDFHKGSRHFQCTLLCNGLGFDFWFSQGASNLDVPTVEDALMCLASDAHSTKDNSFEEWCRDLGYDDDSRKALSIYEACEETANELERLLGSDALNELYYETSEDGE